MQTLAKGMIMKTTKAFGNREFHSVRPTVTDNLASISCKDKAF